jgi:hypothetical protein
MILAGCFFDIPLLYKITHNENAYQKFQSFYHVIDPGNVCPYPGCKLPVRAKKGNSNNWPDSSTCYLIVSQRFCNG